MRPPKEETVQSFLHLHMIHVIKLKCRALGIDYQEFMREQGAGEPTFNLEAAYKALFPGGEDGT